MTETKTKTEFDFNDAGPQKSLMSSPRTPPSAANDGTPGWRRRWRLAQALGRRRFRRARLRVRSCRRRVCETQALAAFYVAGTTSGHAEAGEISRNTLRAILESARGIKPDDKSEAAAAHARLRAGRTSTRCASSPAWA
jgi:hypothetical protein